jgi:hypothetical protein
VTAALARACASRLYIGARGRRAALSPWCRCRGGGLGRTSTTILSRPAPRASDGGCQRIVYVETRVLFARKWCYGAGPAATSD